MGKSSGIRCNTSSVAWQRNRCYPKTHVRTVSCTVFGCHRVIRSIHYAYTRIIYNSAIVKLYKCNLRISSSSCHLVGPCQRHPSILIFNETIRDLCIDGQFFELRSGYIGLVHPARSLDIGFVCCQGEERRFFSAYAATISKMAAAKI